VRSVLRFSILIEQRERKEVWETQKARCLDGHLIISRFSYACCSESASFIIPYLSGEKQSIFENFIYISSIKKVLDGKGEIDKPR